MHYIEGNNRFYICGIPGNYTIKCCGNNRIAVTGLVTLARARKWLKIATAFRSPYNKYDRGFKESSTEY